MPVQSALPAGQSWLDILVGSGVRDQALREQDTLAGRELQRSGLSGYVTNPQGGGYMNTLARDQFDSTLAEMDRGYALDVARFGLAQADLNYRQRATEAQDRMQQMALQVSQRGPANAIGYNYLLNNRNAPAGTEKPYGGANISQPANITIPTPAPRAVAPPPTPKPPASGPLSSYTPPEGALNPGAAGGAGFVATNPGLTPEQSANILKATSAPAPTPGVWQPSDNAETLRQFNNIPKAARGGVLDAEPEADVDNDLRGLLGRVRSKAGGILDAVTPDMSDETEPGSVWFQEGWRDAARGTIDRRRIAPPQGNTLEPNRGYYAGMQAYNAAAGGGAGEQEAPSRGIPRRARGGFLDSMSAGQTATAMVGDSPSGAPTGAEEMATATVTPDGQPRLIVAPMQGSEPNPDSPEFQRGYQDAQRGTLDQQAMRDPNYQAGAAAFQSEQGQQGGMMAAQPAGGFLDSMSAEQMPRMASGGVVNPPSYAGGAGMSGGTTNTAYTPQDIANTPVVKQATGQENVSRFGAFAGDTSIPGTDTKLPSGAEFRIDSYADMLPSSRALLESIVSTPREMGGLGLDFGDYLESSRRAAPIGRRFGPAAYGA